MQTISTMLVLASGTVLAAAYLGYPLLLRILARRRNHGLAHGPHASWPRLSIVVVVRNAEPHIRRVLNGLVALAYPADRRQILVVSDASNDFTDAVVRSFAHRGVELLRLSRPRGHAAALNAARRWVRGNIVVVVDPAARPRPSSLAALIAPFADPQVGVAYGREVTESDATGSGRESAWSSYEASLRDLETRVFGTVSARASLYASRPEVFLSPVPAWQSPDFAAMLRARERGFRAVAVADAQCVMDTARSLHGEYARKVGAMAREVATLLASAHLLNPVRYGAFAWMLMGHKLCRWLLPWATLGGLTGVLLLAPTETWAMTLLAAGAMASALAGLAWIVPEGSLMGRWLAIPGRLASTMVAVGHALVRALQAAPDIEMPRAPRPLLAGALAQRR